MGGKSGSGGGGGTQQQSNVSGSTSSQTNLPSWLDQASQLAVGGALGLAADPKLFQPYSGQQVADISSGTQQAWQNIQDPTATAATTGAAANQLYGTMAPLQAQQQAALQGGYNTAQGLLGGYMGGPTTAAQVGANAQALMTPYQQQVIDPTLALGRQALAQNLQQIGAAANQANAFGGSRQGVMEGVAQAQAALGAQNTLGQLLNQGWGQALTPANQIGLQAGAQGYGGAGLLANAAMNNATQMGQWQQAQGLGALQTASPYQQQYLQNLSGMGQQQQQQQQAQLNAAMGTYYGQQQAPIQNLDLLLSAIGAVPYGTSSTGSTNQSTYGQGIQNLGSGGDVAGNIIGGMTTAAGLLGNAGKAWDTVSGWFA